MMQQLKQIKNVIGRKVRPKKGNGPKKYDFVDFTDYGRFMIQRISKYSSRVDEAIARDLQSGKIKIVKDEYGMERIVANGKGIS
ncbi:MAG: hypothetical protein ABID38_02365 [Candidatus Diapherotrites archaeon]